MHSQILPNSSLKTSPPFASKMHERDGPSRLARGILARASCAMTGIRGESLENSALTGEVEKSSRQQKPTFKKGKQKNTKTQNDSDPKISMVR